MKKMISEANVELGHAVRRAEQYETEVKRLRTRIEELKKELTMAEDEIDAASSAIRRLQRNNEELNTRYSKFSHCFLMYIFIFVRSYINTKINNNFFLINYRTLLFN